MGELDVGVTRLDTVLPAKLYAEDKLKIQQKSTEMSREYPLLAGVTAQPVNFVTCNSRQ